MGGAGKPKPNWSLDLKGISKATRTSTTTSAIQGKSGFMAETGNSLLISLQHLPQLCAKGARNWQKESGKCGRAPMTSKT